MLFLLLICFSIQNNYRSSLYFTPESNSTNQVGGTSNTAYWRIDFGKAPREDRCPLPKQSDGVWKWNRTDSSLYNVRMMKDATSSAGNAAISIWGDDKTDVGMCSFHAFQR